MDLYYQSGESIVAHCQEFADAVEQSTEVEVPAALALLEARLQDLMNCEMEHQMMAASSGMDQNRRMEIRHSEFRHSMEVLKDHTKRIGRMAAGTK